MKIGDVVKFSPKHFANSPGHAYVKDWIGVILEMKTGDPIRNGTWEERLFCGDFDKIEIMWSHDDLVHISEYDEQWWNKLDYEPFEVLNEAG
jgi:hypothetical protein